MCLGKPNNCLYDKLWHRLAEKGMKKQDLREIAGISRASIAKLGKNENVTTEVLDKVCRALHCDIGDIAEVRNISQDTDLIEDASLKETFRVNSFFAGIGGFDIGFERHGFETVYLCEINDYCTPL